MTMTNPTLHSGYALNGYQNPYPTALWCPTLNPIDDPKSTARQENTESHESSLSSMSVGLLPSPRKRNCLSEGNPTETKKRLTTTHSDEVPPGFEAPLVFYQPWSPTSFGNPDNGTTNAFLQYQQQLVFAQQAMAFQQSLLPMGYPFNFNKQ